MTKSVNKPINFREIFTQPVGEIISLCSNMSDKQRNEVLHLQGNLIAISLYETTHNITPRSNLYGIDIAKSSEVIAKIPEDIRDNFKAKGLETAISQKGAPRDVPLFGMLAVKMGYVSPEVRDALLLAQAAERTTQAHDGTCPTSKIFADAFTSMQRGNTEEVTKLLNDKMFKRDFISREKTKPLQAAQAIQHLADIVAGFIAAKSIAISQESEETKEAATTSPQTKLPDSINAAKPALLMLAKHYYKEAGTTLSKLAENPANGLNPEINLHINNIVNELRAQTKTIYPAISNIIDSAIRPATKLYNGLKAVQTIIQTIRHAHPEHPEWAKCLEDLVNNRLHEIKNAQHEKSASQELRSKL